MLDESDANIRMLTPAVGKKLSQALLTIRRGRSSRRRDAAPLLEPVNAPLCCALRGSQRRKPAYYPALPDHRYRLAASER